MENLLLLSFLISFLATLLLTPRWIKKAKQVNLVGKDMHKCGKDGVAEAGGVNVIIGTSLGILFYVFVKTFYFSSSTGLIEILALLVTLLLAAFIGFVDDIFGWKSGLSQRSKVLSTIPIAIPLAVINAGSSTVVLPFMGSVNLGIVFPLILIPAGIIGATNGFNMLAGYNALESGLGIIILSALSFVLWLVGESYVSLLALCMVFSLIAFLVYNKPPARVFPGDALTYPVGAMIASIAIIGGAEKIAIFLFLPFYIQFLLKARGRFKRESYGKLLKDETITMPYDHFYGLEHIAIWLCLKIKKKCYEKDVVIILLSFAFLVAAATVILWMTGLL